MFLGTRKNIGRMVVVVVLVVVVVVVGFLLQVQTCVAKTSAKCMTKCRKVAFFFKIDDWIFYSWVADPLFFVQMVF